MAELKIVTLNCWGIPVPIVCKNRAERISAIGKELAKGEYDIAVLEEIWTEKDYQKLCEDVYGSMPYTHYFYSGVIGSGVCVFSKCPILETFFHPFLLNGHVYKVQHFDWFGGKGIGLCKLLFNGFRVNLYATHREPPQAMCIMVYRCFGSKEARRARKLNADYAKQHHTLHSCMPAKIHAEYNRVDDEYLPHRISQAVETSQFIRHTSRDCDLLVVVGDFNMEPTDVGYNYLVTCTPLLDAWHNKGADFGETGVGSTYANPQNPFSDRSLAGDLSEGKRIDYIMYYPAPGVRVTVDKCFVTFGPVPGEDFFFSDHQAVAAVLSLASCRSSVPGEPSVSCTPQLGKDAPVYRRKAQEILRDGMCRVQRSSCTFQLLALGLAVLFLCLLCCPGKDSPLGTNSSLMIVTGLVKMGVLLAIAALLWLGIVVKRCEMHSLRAVHLDLQHLIGREDGSR